MFRKMPFVLLCIILLALVAQPWMSLSFQERAYALSLSIKSLIIFALPFLIFGLLFRTAAQMAKGGTKIIVFLLVLITASNFASTMLSYSIGKVAYGLDFSITFPKEGEGLQPAWIVTLPKWIANSIAMFSGLALGVILTKFKPTLAGRVSSLFDRIIGVMMKGFLYVIPLFIGGFVVKLAHDKVMTQIVGNYAFIFGLVGCSVFAYIGFLYLVANGFHRSSFLQSMKNMLPAAITGFGSMSSAAALPMMLLGVEKNARNPDLARGIVPATVNIHLIGDCFALPIFAFAILKNFGIAEPSLTSYLVFALYFVIAKFSVAAVPGGGVLVMLPVLESTLGFNAEMLSLITALYILFDPVITCANVCGNGASALLFSRILGKFQKNKLGSELG